MAIEHHSLVNEFPHLRSQIHSLKGSSQHFARLFDEYHDVDREIHRAEEGIDARADVYVEDLKKKRVQLKDALYRMLQTTQ